jgi:branched-subunit amino acid transport protein AzlD
MYNESNFVKMVGKSMIAGILTVVVQEVLKNVDCDFF